MARKMAVIFMMFCMLLVGCNNGQVRVSCEYENIEECEMGDIISDNNQLYHITELMKEHSVKIKNQKVPVSEYEIKLDEYFYNKNTGVAVYKFIISTADVSSLTDAQYKKLVKLHENGELDLINERGSRPLINILQKDKNDQVVWYNGCMLSAISPQDKVTDITQKDSLSSATIYFMNDEAGEVFLPAYNYEESIIEFDVSKNQGIISAKMTESGLCIIWDIGDILTEFYSMIKELPEGEDPEGYNYSIYKDIFIHMKDGTKFNVLDFYCGEEIREEHNIACFNAIWKDGISLGEVDSLEIDGMTYDIN